MNKITFYLITLLVFSFPWENAINIGGILNLGRVVGLLAAIIGIFAVLQKGKLKKPWNFHIILIIFIVWGLMSYYWSVSPTTSLQRLFTNVQLLVFVWLIWEFVNTKKQFIIILQAYVIGAYIPIIMLIYNLLNNNTAFIGRYTIEGTNPNFLGLMLIIGFLMAIYLVQVNKNRTLFLLNIIYIPFSIFGIILTGSRTSIVIALIAILYFAWPYFTRLKLRGKVLTFIFTLMAVYMVFYFTPEVTIQRAFSLSGEIESGDFGNRSSIWAAGIDSLRDNYLFGIGVGAYSDLMAMTRGVSVSAHNSFLSVLVELGIVGLMIFITILTMLLSIIKNCPKELRSFWLFTLLALFIGMNFLSWEYGKILWILFGLIPVSLQIYSTSLIQYKENI